MRQIQRQLLVLGASLAALGVSASSPSSRQEMRDSLVADHHIMVIGVRIAKRSSEIPSVP